MKKYALYIRKSSEGEDRQIASLDSQYTFLSRIAEERGYKIVKEYSEAKSAKKPGRVKFNEMMSDLENGVVNSILCWKLDRLARNPVDGGQLQWKLQCREIKEIVTADRIYLPEDNVLMMSVEFGVANQFVIDLGKNTRRGMVSKAERGYSPTLAPLGYMPNPNKVKGNKEIIKDPDRFDIVQKLFNLMLKEHYSVAQVYDIAINQFGLDTRKGKKIAKSNFYRILRDPFYYGEFEFPKGSGNWYKGKHPAMITKSEYNKIQTIMSRKAIARPRVNFFTYTGLILCGECGRSITAENKSKKCKNGNVHKYVYYHCSKSGHKKCPQSSVEVKQLELQIMDKLKDIYIPEEIVEWAITQIRKDESKDKLLCEENKAKLLRDKSKVEGKISNLVDLLLDKSIDKTQYELKKKEFEAEILRIESAIQSVHSNVEVISKKTEEVFILSESAVRKFKFGSRMDKREILSAIQSKLFLEDKKLTIELKKPLSILKEGFKAYKEEMVKNGLVEPTQSLMNIGLNTDLAYMKSHLYPGEDSNLRPTV